MTIIYPGSFDPVTLGHIDIAQRGAKVADKLIIAVLDNPNKKSLFSVNERLEFLQDALGNVPNIEIDSFSGLLAEYVARRRARAILRGVRGAEDFQQEVKYATYNNLLASIETFFIAASPSLQHISSSMVREAAQLIYANAYSDLALDSLVTSKVKAALKNMTVR